MWSEDRKLSDALERLLPGARAGREREVGELCRLVRPFVNAYLQRHLAERARRWEDVDDVVQQVLVETVRELPRIPPEAGAGELLRRVRRTAKSRAMDALRNNGRLNGESVTPAGPGGPGTPTRSVGDVTAEDRRRWLREFVARLPPRYSEVVRLCALEELTCVEAGRRLGLEPDTVRKRYEAARRELARRLADHDGV